MRLDGHCEGLPVRVHELDRNVSLEGVVLHAGSIEDALSHKRADGGGELEAVS